MTAPRLSTAEEIAGALRATRNGEGQWQACCPSHPDKNPSLSIGTGQNGRALVHCFAGCDPNDVLAALERDHRLVLRKPKGAARPRRGTRTARKPSPRGEVAAAPAPTAEPDPSQPPAEDNPQEPPKSGTGAVKAEDVFTPIIPPPPDEDWQYSALLNAPRGELAGTFGYHSAAGELEGYVRRFDFTDKDGKPDKVFLPLRYGTLRGYTGWHAKGWGDGRPLYRLPQLLASPEAPVLVTEGELKANSGARLFPDLATVAPMNGAKSPAKTDWSPLRGRGVIVWPDHDQPGAKFAQEVARLATDAGATGAWIVQVPDSFPPKWDLANPPPEGADLRALLEAAEPWQRSATPAKADKRQPDDLASYEMREDGLYFSADPEKPAIRLCGRFEIAAETRASDGGAWGLLLRWRDRDNRPHEWAMPRSMLAGDGSGIREQLLDGGLFVSPSRFARERLGLYLAAVEAPERARCVDKTGWHGGVYVTPNRVYGAGEHVILQGLQRTPPFETKGDCGAWQREVAAVAEDNSRLAFSLSAALAGPLLDLVGEESHGFHFSGRSSIGKTTALRVAASVWGTELKTWRTTDNASEGWAHAANDGLLLLDELSQVDGRAAAAMTYMLGNSAGKGRMRRDGGVRPSLSWRLVFLSTGEVGLAEKMAEQGKRARAGQGVRMIEIGAEVGRFGMFEALHGAESGEAFATVIKTACERHAGHAADRFLEELARNTVTATLWVTKTRQEWLAKHLPPGADGQVSRVAAKFALVAAAGELAADFGILPWARDAASNAAATCFKAWLAKRGTTGASEVEEGIAQVRLFVEQHGASRFASLEETVYVDRAGNEERHSRDDRTINRAGFRKKADGGGWDYLVLPEVWRREVCKGFDAGAIAREMVKRGLMVAGPDKKTTRSERVPGVEGTVRCYRIAASIIVGDSTEPPLHAGTG